MRSNPLAEHNAGIALSSKEMPPQNSGTGNMYNGQAGRAFVQGGGGMSQYHSFAGGSTDTVHARGSYAPVSVGYNSITQGGRRRSKRSKRRVGGGSKRKATKKYGKKCNCLLIGGRRHHHPRCCKKNRGRSQSRKMSQYGGSSFANAAYSIAGPGTEVGRNTTALANPAPYTAYNSCHPVA
jgi:hypothetical protein